MSDNRTNGMRQEAAAKLHEMLPGYMWQHYLDAVDALDVVAAGGQLSGISGQFTEVQVEAATRAAYPNTNFDDPELSELCEMYRSQIRRALVAAQGATPQAESDAAKVAQARDVIDRMFGWKHLRKYGPMSEAWMDQLRDGIARAVHGGSPQKLSLFEGFEPSCYCMSSLDGEGDGHCPVHREEAPVLPSSTCQHNMVSYTDSVAEKREHFCSLCGYEPSSAVDEDALAEVLRTYLPMGEDPALNATAKAQARAVAEWLKGQGR